MESEKLGTCDLPRSAEQFLAVEGFADSRAHSSTAIAELIERYVKYLQSFEPTSPPAQPAFAMDAKEAMKHVIAHDCSPPATAGTLEKYFVDKTHDGWGIFYNEPNAPETGRACIGGSADEHIARLRCQILNSHIADVLDAVGFAKTQERLTGRCLCVGAWKSGCPVHDNSPATAGTAREFYKLKYGYEPQRHETFSIEAALKFADEHADQKVRPLQASLAKLYAAIGPMDELDTVDDAVARVEKLRQERDALRKELDATTNSN